MLLFVGSLMPNVERKTLALLKITCNGQLLAFMCYLQARFNEKGVYGIPKGYFLHRINDMGD